MIDTAVKCGLIWRIVARLALSYAVKGKEKEKKRKKKKEAENTRLKSDKAI